MRPFFHDAGSTIYAPVAEHYLLRPGYKLKDIGGAAREAMLT